MVNPTRIVNQRFRVYNTLFDVVVHSFNTSSLPAEPHISSSKRRWSLSFGFPSGALSTSAVIQPTIEGTDLPVWHFNNPPTLVKFDEFPVEVTAQWNINVSGPGSGNLLVVETLIRQ